MMKDSFKNIFSFEFWQKFGKALMVVVAVMPAAGLMISIGKSIPMINPNLGVLVTTGGVLEQIGWGVIGNLHILFALAIGGSWAKERAGGAFAAGLSFIAGFVGATAYNKYYNFRKLPDALSFFNGKRFVPFVVILRSVIVAIVLSFVWPVVQSGINSFGIWIANSQDTAPVLVWNVSCFHLVCTTC